MHNALDFGEIDHHAVVIQFAGLAIDLYNPVVAMQVFTFALMRESQVMRT